MTPFQKTWVEPEEFAGSEAEERLAALSYVGDAWDEATLDGLPEESVAHAAIFRALTAFVSTFGEEATADYIGSLGDKIRRGEYTTYKARN